MLAYNPGMMSPHRPGTPKKKKNLNLKVKYVIETKRQFPEKIKKNKSLNPPSKDKV
jgi:hypothetical protein